MRLLCRDMRRFDCFRKRECVAIEGPLARLCARLPIWPQPAVERRRFRLIAREMWRQCDRVVGCGQMDRVRVRAVVRSLWGRVMKKSGYFQRIATGVFFGATLSAMCVIASDRAVAATFNIAGLTDPLNTGIVDFSFDGIDTITVEIENTSTSGPDPRVTGFAFNVPDAVTGVDFFTATGTEDNTDWMYAFDPDGINPPQIDVNFDLAGITGPNIAGGDPNSGIMFGKTGIFTFMLTGNDLASLTEDSFLGISSDGHSFAARFQRTGTDGEGSDVAVPVAPIPLPAAGFLLIGALGGLGLAARRRRRGA